VARSISASCARTDIYRENIAVAIGRLCGDSKPRLRRLVLVDGKVAEGTVDPTTAKWEANAQLIGVPSLVRLRRFAAMADDAAYG
jgi:hypothetical protein